MNFNVICLDEEIKAAMWRNMVEEKYFKCHLYEDINDETKDKFTDYDFYNKEENKFNMSNLKKEIKKHEKHLRFK
jgi:hypothetical protein